jgi:hypothetical protein
VYSKDENFTKLGSTFTAGEYIRTLTMLRSNKKNMKEKRMKRRAWNRRRTTGVARKS